MEMVGADVAELRQLSTQMSKTSELFGKTASAISATLSRSAWQGPDARAFRDAWNRHLHSSLVRASEHLSSASKELTHQADEQERASSQGGVIGAGASGGTDPGTWPWEDGGYWPWDDGWRWPWEDSAPVDDDIPLDEGQFTNDNTGQRSFPDCVVISALAEMGVDDTYLLDHIRQLDDGTYEVTLYDDRGNPVTYTVQDVDGGGVRGPDGSQTWMTLYEDALIQHGMLNDDGTYANGAVKVFQAVTGAPGTRTFDGDEGYPSFADVQQAAQNGTPLVVGTNSGALTDQDARDAGVEPLQIAENHAYMVESVNPDGSVTLVNPWGPGSPGYGGDAGGHRLTVTAEQYDFYFHSAYAPAARSDWKD